MSDLPSSTPAASPSDPRAFDPSAQPFLDLLRADARKLTRLCPTKTSKVFTALANRGMQAIFLYRLSHLLWRSKIPLLPLLLTRLAQFLYAVDISYHATLGPGIVIVHGFGLVIGQKVIIEGDCCLFHGVTLGDRGSEWVASSRTDGHPHVQSGCMLGAGAKILGPITIGTNSVIGANAVVLNDIQPNSVAAGIPAKVVSTRPLLDINLRPVPLPTTQASN